MATPTSVQGSFLGQPPPAVTARRGRLLVGLDLLDVLFVALLVADVVGHDPTFSAIFGVLVVRAFVGSLGGTLARLVVVTLALTTYGVVHGFGEVVSGLEVAEWGIQVALVAIIAVLAARRERRSRHFAALYQAAAEQLLTSQEEQRLRLARDLHDGVGQGVGALMLMLDAAAYRLADEPESAALVESARESAAAVLTEVRDVATRLHPEIHHPAGLAGAIRALTEHAGVPVSLAMDPRVGPGLLPPESETALFRILQEAVGNAARHAGGARIRVTVEVVSDEVRAAVRDDGPGFVLGRAVGTGIGLASMRDRAVRAGGSLRIATRPGRGTTVSVILPRGTRPPAHPARRRRRSADRSLQGAEP